MFLAPKSNVSSPNVDSHVETGIDITRKNYQIEFLDTENPNVKASAGLLGRKLFLRIDTRYINSEGKIIRSNNLKGKDIFNRIMIYFHGRFDKIQAIWEQPKDNELSDNYVIFYNALNAGKSHKQAAFETWTGKMATQYGFTEASIKKFKKNRTSKIEGLSKYEFDRVEVLFGKPSKLTLWLRQVRNIFLSA